MVTSLKMTERNHQYLLIWGVLRICIIENVWSSSTFVEHERDIIVFSLCKPYLMQALWWGRV